MYSRSPYSKMPYSRPFGAGVIINIVVTAIVKPVVAQSYKIISLTRVVTAYVKKIVGDNLLSTLRIVTAWVGKISSGVSALSWFSPWLKGRITQITDFMQGVIAKTTDLIGRKER